MDTFSGRRASSQEWVAFGPYAELAHAASLGAVVEVTLPTRAVARVRITRVGRPWQHQSGVTVAYGGSSRFVVNGPTG